MGVQDRGTSCRACFFWGGWSPLVGSPTCEPTQIMSLAEGLSGLCPGPGRDASDTELDLALHPCDGSGILCHEMLLRARCPELPPTISGGVEVCEDTSVLIALLRWVYCERL